MLKRLQLEKVTRLFEIAPICAILGPRQCGKTTLARQYASGQQKVYFLTWRMRCILLNFMIHRLYFKIAKG